MFHLKKDLLEKAAALKRFENSPLGKAFEKQTNVIEKQSEIINKKEESEQMKNIAKRSEIFYFIYLLYLTGRK